MYHVSLSSNRESILASGLDAVGKPSPWQSARDEGRLTKDQPVGNYTFVDLCQANAYAFNAIHDGAKTDIWHVERGAVYNWTFDPELLSFVVETPDACYGEKEEGCCDNTCSHWSTFSRWYTPTAIPASSLTLVDMGSEYWLDIARTQRQEACVVFYASNPSWADFCAGNFSVKTNIKVPRPRARALAAA